MTSTGAVVSTPSTNAKSSSLGISAFRPNGIQTANEFRTMLGIEIIVFFILWLFLPTIIPSPLVVLQSLQELIIQKGLLGELWTSLTLSAEAIGWSTAISLVLSYGSVVPIIRPLASAVGSTRFLSMAGLSFIATLFFGGGHTLKLVLLTFGMTGFFTRSMVDVVLQVSTDRLDYVRTLRASEFRVLLEAQIYGTLGAAFDVLRQNAAMGWLMLTMVEGLVRSEGGIGRMLLDQEKHFSLAAILAVQTVVLLVGMAQDRAITTLKSWFAPWAVSAYSKGKR